MTGEQNRCNTGVEKIINNSVQWLDVPLWLKNICRVSDCRRVYVQHQSNITVNQFFETPVHLSNLKVLCQISISLQQKLFSLLCFNLFKVFLHFPFAKHKQEDNMEKNNSKSFPEIPRRKRETQLDQYVGGQKRRLLQKCWSRDWCCCFGLLDWVGNTTCNGGWWLRLYEQKLKGVFYTT